MPFTEQEEKGCNTINNASKPVNEGNTFRKILFLLHSNISLKYKKTIPLPFKNKKRTGMLDILITWNQVKGECKQIRQIRYYL